jgi:hypothetical protein
MKGWSNLSFIKLEGENTDGKKKLDENEVRL